MRILLDECLPRPLKKLLKGHECATAAEMGWAGRDNGELLGLAEGEFDVFLTVDRSLPREQNISRFRIAVIVLRARRNTFETLEPIVPLLLKALDTARPGEITQLG